MFGRTRRLNKELLEQVAELAAEITGLEAELRSVADDVEDHRNRLGTIEDWADPDMLEKEIEQLEGRVQELELHNEANDIHTMLCVICGCTKPEDYFDGWLAALHSPDLRSKIDPERPECDMCDLARVEREQAEARRKLGGIGSHR